jgi:hypothetical protein
MAQIVASDSVFSWISIHAHIISEQIIYYLYDI